MKTLTIITIAFSIASCGNFNKSSVPTTDTTKVVVDTTKIIKDTVKVVAVTDTLKKK